MICQALTSKLITSCYNLKEMEFSDWLTQKYIEWRGNAIGNDRSISEFARIIGVSQSLVSQWMKKDGKIPRNRKSISSLANFLGFEVYEILGFPVPDPAESLLYDFPPEWREAFLEARAEYTAELSSKDITTDTPEARQIIKEAFDRHGIKFTIT